MLDLDPDQEYRAWIPEMQRHGHMRLKEAGLRFADHAVFDRQMRRPWWSRQFEDRGL
jgi:hypothetical protein